MTENWKPVPGFEWLYEVSDWGRVKSLHGGGRILRCSTQTRGHVQAHLFANGIAKHILLGKLVMESFIGPPPDGMEVCHLDLDLSNNALTNLEYRTHKEILGMREVRHLRGEDCPASILTEEDVREIGRIVERDGVRIDITYLARKYEMSYGGVLEIVRGRNWKHIKRPILKGKLVNKLSNEEIAEIRRTCQKGVRGKGVMALSKKYNVNPSQISRIVNGKVRNP